MNEEKVKNLKCRLRILFASTRDDNLVEKTLSEIDD
jgi:hypothetical protein